MFQHASPYKNDIVTFVTASKYRFERKNDVLLTLYSEDERYSMERVLLSQVKEMANTVVKIKKGLIK